MMLYPAMSLLNKYVENRYLLVNVVARRARQIAEQADEEGYPLCEKPRPPRKRGQMAQKRELQAHDAPPP